MASNHLRYHSNAERPVAELWPFDDDGALIDFSPGGYPFSFKIGNKGETALLTKTTNIAGAAGSGTEPAGVPNITITWTTGELNLATATYTWQLTATITGLDRTFEGQFT